MGLFTSINIAATGMSADHMHKDVIFFFLTFALLL